MSSSTGVSTCDTETPVKLLDSGEEGVMPYDVLRESMGELRKLKSYERISYGLSDKPRIKLYMMICL